MLNEKALPSEYKEDFMRLPVTSAKEKVSHVFITQFKHVDNTMLMLASQLIETSLLIQYKQY